MALSRCSLPASTPGCASATSGAGDDLATIGASRFLILDAGFGKDTLSLATGVNLDLSTLGHSRLTGFEVIDLSVSFTFHAQHVFDAITYNHYHSSSNEDIDILIQSGISVV